MKPKNIKANPFFNFILPSYKKVFIEYEHCVDEFNKINTEHNNLSARCVELKEKVDQLESLVSTNDSVIKTQETTIGNLESQAIDKDKEIEEYKSQLSASEENLKNSENTLSEIVDSLKETQSRYSLVVASLSAEIKKSERYEMFHHVFQKKFMPFTSNLSILKNEGEVVLKLKSIEDQLRLIESLYHFKNKTIVAVSGGFSSGKSSFISSLFADADIQLPIGVEPITAIPTYVCHSNVRKIAGYNDKGGVVEISSSLYSQLSHKFVEGFGFNLKDLLPFIALETPMEKFHNISFIDLPGYNPGDRGGVTEEDVNIASEFMQQAGAVIWVIGLDANGTISRADIDFLYDNVAEGVKLYIVLNKADLKPRSDIEDVIESVCEMLDFDDISYEGISAYSSEMQEEIGFYNKTIYEFLEECDTPIDSYANIKTDLISIFSHYQDAFLEAIEKTKRQHSILVSLELDLHEIGAFETDDIVNFDPSKYLKKKKSSSLSKSPLQQDAGGSDKLDKINEIRENLTDIKMKFDYKEVERQLESLRKIEKMFLSLFDAQ